MVGQSEATCNFINIGQIYAKFGKNQDHFILNTKLNLFASYFIK